MLKTNVLCPGYSVLKMILTLVVKCQNYLKWVNHLQKWFLHPRISPFRGITLVYTVMNKWQFIDSRMLIWLHVRDKDLLGHDGLELCRHYIDTMFFPSPMRFFYIASMLLSKDYILSLMQCKIMLNKLSY